MMNFNVRCKSIALVTMITISNCFVLVGTQTVVDKSKQEVAKVLPSVARCIPGSRAAVIVTAITVIAMWIRLNTKGSSFNYKLKDWRSDFDLFLKSFNIFDAESRATLLMLFDKWIIGRQLSIIDVSYESEDDNGTVTILKDKKLKAKPFGLMGFIDAYALIQFKKINEFAKEINGVITLINNPMAALTKDAKGAKDSQ